MPSLRPTPLTPQHTIGKYTLHTQIGVGGMASVYLGWMSGPGDFSRIAAIKRMHAQFASDQAFVTRFRDEAWLSARLLHPNIVQVVDVVDSNDALLMVMDYVHGVSLRTLWSDAQTRGVPLPLAMIAGIVVPALHGLHAAHEATDDHGHPIGIVHRDFSPQNIMVGTDGHTRILDFGIAKARTHLHVTTTGCFSGKIGYLAPEQIQGNPLDRRTDVFAAGIILWEMLAGRRLFSLPGIDEAAAIHRLLKQPIPAPETINPRVPRRLSEIVMRALERTAEARFGSARELAMELEAAIEVASPSRVGDWIGHVCAPRVAELSRMLNEVRRAMTVRAPVSAGSARPTLPQPLPSTGAGADAVTVNAKTGRRASAGRAWLVAALVCLALVAAVFLRRPAARLWKLASSAPSAATAPMPTSAAVTPSRGVTPQATVTGTIEPLPPTPPEPEPPTKGQAPAPKPHAMVSAARPGAAKHHAVRGKARVASPASDRATRSSGAVTARPNCDPPTYIDSEGIRVFKDECL